jgi:hypothetical protein
MNGSFKEAIVTHVTAPRSWRMLLPETDDEEAEEIVLRVQGILCNKDLPPISKVPR